jgi:hypothetical protein
VVLCCSSRSGGFVARFEALHRAALPGLGSGTVDFILEVSGYFDDPAHTQPPDASAGPDQSVRTPTIPVDSGRSAIWVGEVDGGPVTGNTIGRFNQHPELPIYGIPPWLVQQVLDD